MDFENGTLDVPGKSSRVGKKNKGNPLIVIVMNANTEGTTLRCHLSKVLNCDPMRITKKYTGNSSIGKRTFTPLIKSPENISFIDMSRKDLDNLRANWVNKLLIAEQVNQRKLGNMKGNGRMFLGQEFGVGGYGVMGRLAQMSEDGLLFGTGGVLPGFLDGTNTPFQDEKILLALQPYCNDPAELAYLLNWLKTSFYALQNSDVSLNELDNLIQTGETSLPGIYKVVESKANVVSQQQQQQQQQQRAHPQLEDLQKVIEAYFDYRRLPSDVANRIYQQPKVSGEEGVEMSADGDSGSKSKGGKGDSDEEDNVRRKQHSTDGAVHFASDGKAQESKSTAADTKAEYQRIFQHQQQRAFQLQAAQQFSMDRSTHPYHLQRNASQLASTEYGQLKGHHGSLQQLSMSTLHKGSINLGHDVSSQSAKVPCAILGNSRDHRSESMESDLTTQDASYDVLSKRKLSHDDSIGNSTLSSGALPHRGEADSANESQQYNKRLKVEASTCAHLTDEQQRQSQQQQQTQAAQLESAAQALLGLFHN